ncbi:MAG TPA: hypothetical protein VG992_02695 [Candidatus Saccharimonadales bacterium]|nr:hypothetical protein [Candidatus Saccharimonadales bacterium]
MHKTWTMGVYVGLPIGILVLAICVIMVAIGILTLLRSDDYYNNGGFLTFVGTAIGVITLAVMAFAFFPFHAAYHQWRPVSGTVTQLGSRVLSSDDNATNQQFALVINHQNYSCSDARCSLVKVGDYVSLSCIKSNVNGGVDANTCNFVARRAG